MRSPTLQNESTIQAAVEYVRAGLAVLPIKPRSKKPRPKNWTSFKVQEAEIPSHFGNGENIGLLLGKPSGGLLDVDLDCPEALKLAAALLPATPLIHGRRSKPASHWWYRTSTPPAKVQRFCDLDGTSLAELRSTGGQTVVPPSVHESGEAIFWESKGEPADIDSRTLTQAVAKVAAAALLVRHWPTVGTRHDAALALAGILLRSGWSQEDTSQFVVAIASAAGDEEAPLRVRDVVSTAARLSSGREATGGRTLARIVGDDVVNRVRSWLKLARVAVASQISSTFASDADLAAAIREVALCRETPSFDKRRQITHLVQEWLAVRGDFLRTNDGRAFFFHKQERRLYDVDQTPFRHLLTQVSGLAATENYLRFTLDLLQTAANRTTRLAEVHTFAHFDNDQGILAVSDGSGGVWVHGRKGEWKLQHNGDDSLLFLADPHAKAWVPDFSRNGHELEWFLSQFMFANAPLPAEDYRTLMFIYLVQQFFPPLRRTRMIPAFLGPQGSGKTTAMRLLGRLLVGPEFDVTGLQREREDAFIAAACNRVIVGLDNADSKIPFLPDALARYATGQRYQLRRLYTTNEEASFSPRAILMISSRDPQFNRPDVAERLLPFHFDRPRNYRPEFQIFTDLEKRRGSIMGALLVRAGEISDSLPEHPAKYLRFRMADFASFGERVFARHGKSSGWIDLLAQLERAQTAFASEGDGIVDTLRLLLERRPVEAMAVGDLFRLCSDIAESHGFILPRSCQSFGRRLTSMSRVIEIELGVHFQESRGHRRLRTISLMPRDGDEGDVGDESGQPVREENVREPA